MHFRFWSYYKASKSWSFLPPWACVAYPDLLILRTTPVAVEIEELASKCPRLPFLVALWMALIPECRLHLSAAFGSLFWQMSCAVEAFILGHIRWNITMMGRVKLVSSRRLSLLCRATDSQNTLCTGFILVTVVCSVLHLVAVAVNVTGHRGALLMANLVLDNVTRNVGQRQVQTVDAVAWHGVLQAANSLRPAVCPHIIWNWCLLSCLFRMSVVVDLFLPLKRCR